MKATGPGGLSLELSERNAALTAVPPADTDDARTDATPHPDWTKERTEVAARQRGVHIAHTVAPSNKRGQEFDLYVYLVGWRRDRFGNPNDLSDIAFAEFYMGPAWGDTVIRVEGRKSKIGFRTASHAPALCLCRVTFTDGYQAVMSRYLDFEMGKAISITE
ncbi:pYEATS domain-containing protein [Terrabacter sp. NPDC080008]|uniref:pYEATS domain-containing protein n=1 Tax=Terrabacter sp. NPDC080008 TaxID=3155176 RepID=UPI00344D1BA8